MTSTPTHDRDDAVPVLTDETAAAAVRELLPAIAEGADERDRDRILPHGPLRLLARAGVLGLTVPVSEGGPGASARTVAEAMRLLGSADLSLAQILQPHFSFLNAVILHGGARLRRDVLGAALRGQLLSNAQAERSGRTAHDHATRIEPRPGGGFRIQGTKYYATGSLLADWLAVAAPAPVPGQEEPRPHAAFVPRRSPGVTVVDDWGGMGQRTTASGTVQLDGVEVDAEMVVPQYRTFEGPTVYGAFAQLLHAAIDTGAARGALERAAELVRTVSRPWFESGVQTAAEDPLLVHRFGELEIQVRAAEALLSEAADRVDEARETPDDGSAAQASIAVAAAKVTGGRAAVDLGSALFELGGTSTAADRLNLHRHWRDARTHSVHDPVRWKVQHVGAYSLNRARPPRHGQI